MHEVELPQNCLTKADEEELPNVRMYLLEDSGLQEDTIDFNMTIELMFVWMMEITQLDRRYKSTHVLHLCSS